MIKKELEKKLNQCEDFRFRDHAITQMKARKITKRMILDNLKRSKIVDYIIEKDPISKKQTLEYRLSNKKTLCVTIRFKRECTYIITALITNKKLVQKYERG